VGQHADAVLRARVQPEWVDCREGPWETEESALLFIEAEVGVEARTRRTEAGWIVEIKVPAPSRHEIAIAASKIDGYFMPSPSKPGGREQEFERARAECLKNLLVQLEHVRGLTYEKFHSLYS
jgi:hypothetical protein